MRPIAIFPVGTSIGGCPDAIAEILKSEPSLEVHLLCGERGAADAPDPSEFCEQIQRQVTDPRVTWAASRQISPFEFSITYQQVYNLISELRQREIDRAYIGVTGGTNPMCVSLFQTAMAYLPTKVIPVYVQARGSQWAANFVASDVRDRITAEEALTTARSGQVRHAVELAKRLPEVDPRWKFLRASLVALAYWEDFNYQEAENSLAQQARKAPEFTTEPLLAPLAGTISRLARHAREMHKLSKDIRDVQNFSTTAGDSSWQQRVSETGALLVADALANSQRRIREGRFTDSVLRSYRAAECATQMRLLAIGIHPSKPDACSIACEFYTWPSKQRELGFKAGLEFLKSNRDLDLNPIEKAVCDLAGTRNRTYLEHGYVRVSEQAARQCFEHSLAICKHLLSSEIDEKWYEFEMCF